MSIFWMRNHEPAVTITNLFLPNPTNKMLKQQNPPNREMVDLNLFCVLREDGN